MPTMLAAVWHIKISRTDLGTTGRRPGPPVVTLGDARLAANRDGGRRGARGGGTDGSGGPRGVSVGFRRRPSAPAWCVCFPPGIVGLPMVGRVSTASAASGSPLFVRERRTRRE